MSTSRARNRDGVGARRSSRHCRRMPSRSRPPRSPRCSLRLQLEISRTVLQAVLGTSASGSQNTAFAPVRAQVPAARLPISADPEARGSACRFLLANGATNSLNLNADSFDFSGNRAWRGRAPLCGRRRSCIPAAVAQAAEDTGVRAYKDRWESSLSNRAVLEAGLRIHFGGSAARREYTPARRATGAPSSVKYSGTISGGGVAFGWREQHHSCTNATVVRRSTRSTALRNRNAGRQEHRGLPGLPTGFDAQQHRAAFDEPLTKAQVIAIVQPFLSRR